MNVDNFKKINKYSANVYKTLVGVYIFLYIIGESNFSSFGISELYSQINNYVIKLMDIILILLIIINMKKIPINKLIFIGISLPVMLFSMYTVGMPLLIPYLFILAYPNDLESEELAVIIYRGMGIATIIILLLCIIGIFPDNIIYRGLDIRHSLGFITPNAMGNTILLILFVYVYANWKKWNFKRTLFWIAIISYVYFYTDSRASCYIGVFLLIMMWLENIKIVPNLINKIILRLPIFIFTIGSIVTLYMTWYFSNRRSILYYSLNTLVSGRLEYLTFFYNQYGFHLFGNKNIQMVSYASVLQSNNFLKWLGMDNSYGYIAISFGIILLISFGIMYYFSQKNMILNKNVMGAMYLVLYAILGFTENYMRTIALNFTLFIFAEYLVHNKLQKDN